MLGELRGGACLIAVGEVQASQVVHAAQAVQPAVVHVGATLHVKVVQALAGKLRQQLVHQGSRRHRMVKDPAGRRSVFDWLAGMSREEVVGHTSASCRHISTFGRDRLAATPGQEKCEAAAPIRPHMYPAEWWGLVQHGAI
jgi:hypothetical protein